MCITIFQKRTDLAQSLENIRPDPTLDVCVPNTSQFNTNV